MVHAKPLQLCPAVYGLTDCSPPVPPAHGILQARALEWGAVSSSRGSSQPRDQTRISRGSWTARGFFAAEPPGKAIMDVVVLATFPAFKNLDPNKIKVKIMINK